MFAKPDNWNRLSCEEKRALRLDSWEKTDCLDFVGPESEANYKKRAHRLRMAYDLKKPDRIIADMSMGVGEYALRRMGFNGKDILYNHEKLKAPIVAFNDEFQPDLAVAAFLAPGKVMDMLDLQTYRWGGRQLPDNQIVQAVEGEYMLPDEYAEFIADPSGFWMKKYLPRMFGELGPMALMPSWPMVSEFVDVGAAAMPFGISPVQKMLTKLMDAGAAMMETRETAGQISRILKVSGFPHMGSFFCKAPFDYLGDTLRGTRGIMTDLFRRPKDVTAACEAYVPILIKSVVEACDRMDVPKVTFPLHKGADGFMSKKQFDEFYWPTLKAVMLGLFEEGITNYMFVEGSYSSRLETIAEMPKFSAVWHFDQTDMRRVKQVLSDNFTIAGNVPASKMCAGSVDDLKAYCDELVALYDDAPGFILAFGCSFENTTDDHIHAFRNSVKKNDASTK